MRPDKQKLNAQQKEGAKRERKDLENRRQPESPAKQGHHENETALGQVRRQDQKGHRLH